MSGRKLKLYTACFAVFCFLLLAGAGFTVFRYAVKGGRTEVIQAAAGLALGFIFAPIIHELGHVLFAKANNLRPVYVKCFCFRYVRKDGVKKFGFANPFASDETQVLPTSSGNMKKRALWYTCGGLIASFLVIATLIVGVFFDATCYVCLGAMLYTGYLTLLNLHPYEYASGKTDTAVFRGIKRGYDEEKVWLAAMEIQGRISEGNSFAEIDESLYYALPQLCEDAPLFAVIHDLRYSYRLEKGELDEAAKELNRLAQAQPYLTDAALQKVSAELVYMHALRGDLAAAEESGKICREYLQSPSASAKRILAAFAAAFGKKDEAKTLKQAAFDAIEKEEIKGLAVFESVLLNRIETE